MPAPKVGDVSECRHCGVRIEFRPTEDRDPHWMHRKQLTGAWRGLWDSWVSCRLSAAPPEPVDDDTCEDCGGRYVRGSHYCFGAD